mgnify:CR=1 FL=1
MTETTIALGKLVPGKANVRRNHARAGVTELAASIEAHGLIQNLVVRKAKKGGKFEVVAGGRRLAALQRLMEEGRAVGGVAVTKTYPVRVVVSEAERDAELSLAENTQREAMHVVDEVLAYRELAEDGMANEDIAARFGQSVVTIRQRLKLANLSPRILDVMREDGMTLEQSKALALSDDHAAQEAAWFEQPDWARSPNHLRAALTQEHVRATERLARFVGVEAYEAAGGLVLRDLFAEDEATFLTNRALLNQLSLAKLEPVAEELRQQGWGWAQTSLESGYTMASGFSRVYAEVREPTEQEQAELQRLGDVYDELVAVLEADDEDEASTEGQRLAEVEAKVAAIQDGLRSFADEVKARAGCMVGIGHDGSLQVVSGLVKPEDRQAVSEVIAGPQDGSDDGEQTEEPAEPENPSVVHSGALAEELTAIRTAALRVELVERPQVALCALLHPLVAGLFQTYRLGRPASAVDIRGENRTLDISIQDPEACKALGAWRGVLENWGERIPGDPAALWDWLMAQEQETLLSLLAVVTAANLNAVAGRFNANPERLAQAGQIADAVALDMAAWWEAGEGYLTRLTKAGIAAVVREAGCGEPVVRAIERGSKADAVAAAAQALQGKGWLPEPFRNNLADEAEDGVHTPGEDAVAIAA